MPPSSAASLRGGQGVLGELADLTQRRKDAKIPSSNLKKALSLKEAGDQLF